MEFVTFDGLRFPIKFLDGRPYVQDAGGKYRVIGAYDSWCAKPKTFRVYIDGIAFHGKIRVTAGSRRASRMITIHDMGLLGAARRAIVDGDVVIEDATGAEYRYGEIFHLQPHDPRFPAFRVRLDPAQ